jgi:hypothetical protein
LATSISTLVVCIRFDLLIGEVDDVGQFVHTLVCDVRETCREIPENEGVVAITESAEIDEQLVDQILGGVDTSHSRVAVVYRISHNYMLQ